MVIPNWFGDFIQAIEVAQSRDDFLAALQQLTAELGFEWCAYLDAYGNDVRGISDYPDEWIAHYLSKDMSIIDPVVRTAKELGTPFEWSVDQMPVRVSKVQTSFMGEAADFGIRSGVSIPIPCGYRHTAMLTLASSRLAPGSRNITDLDVTRDAAIYMHAFAKVRAQALLDGPDFKLSPQETKVLAWSKRGFGASDIAELMGLKEPSVRFHMQGARRKLGANNIQQAIGTATDHGLI
jgi:LuxR family transcriptional activator of conjugal transfer of Ti plasmids